MSFRLSNLGVGVWLAIFGALSGFIPAAQGQGTQRSTRELSGSETNNTEIFRSLKQLGGKDDGLRQLQDELNRTTLSLTRQALDHSVPAGTAPLQIPVLPARKKKNDSSFDGWMSDPDSSLTPGLSGDDYSFPGLDPDAKEGRGKLTWDEIYQKLKKDDRNGSGLGSSVKAGARQPDDIDGDSELPTGIKENATKLKNRLYDSEFGGSIFKPTTARSSFSDFFGIGSKAPTPEESKAHKAYMDKYISSVFGDSTPEAGINALKDMGRTGSSPTAKNPSTTSPLDTLPTTTTPSDLFKPGNTFTSALKPATVPDVNANVLNQWNPLYTEPKLELPKPPTLFTPPVEAPRRRFF